MADDISRKLKGEFKDLPENWIIMLEASAEKLLSISLESMKILTQKGLSAIVLSTSRPCTNLIKLYKNKKINVNKIIVLCCVCKSQDSSVKDTNNVIHIHSVDALTEISVALKKVTEETKNKSFLFLDSISTMLIHNNPKILAKFIHHILVLMRLNNISSILISIEKETDKIVRAQLTQLCDKVIRI